MVFEPTLLCVTGALPSEPCHKPMDRTPCLPNGVARPGAQVRDKPMDLVRVRAGSQNTNPGAQVRDKPMDLVCVRAGSQNTNVLERLNCM